MRDLEDVARRRDASGAHGGEQVEGERRGGVVAGNDAAQVRQTLANVVVVGWTEPVSNHG